VVVGINRTKERSARRSRTPKVPVRTIGTVVVVVVVVRSCFDDDHVDAERIIVSTITRFPVEQTRRYEEDDAFVFFPIVDELLDTV
jgi:hypothetical protein